MRASDFLPENVQYDIEQVKLSAIRSDPDFIEIVARLDGQKIGRAEFQKLAGGRLESAFTFVDQDYRGKGLARRMYEFASRYGRIVPSSAQSQDGKKFWAKNADMIKRMT